MSRITVQRLSFTYEGSFDEIFKDVSLSIDTDWRLGFIGRNGRGKTTFLRLLMGGLRYSGTIDSPVEFEYFPYEIKREYLEEPTLAVMRALVAPFDEWEANMKAATVSGDMAVYGESYDNFAMNGGFSINADIETEAAMLGIKRDALERPFSTLSGGERTKACLAALFLKKNRFLLIDEPTNHLDERGRQLLGEYLAKKSGYILVSHDRALLDTAIDHVLSINRSTITVQKGNYTTWEYEKKMADERDIERNAQLKTEISRLRDSTRRTAEWSDKVEATKIGSHAADRGAIGHKAARMMKRSKAIQTRNERMIEEKEGLMKDLEAQARLKISPLEFHKKRLAFIQDLTIDYGSGRLFEPVSFDVSQGERIRIEGGNGSGKTSLIKLLSGGSGIPYTGVLEIAKGLVVSYVEQDAQGLSGGLLDYARANGVDETLFLTLLRKFDFPRVQFEKDMGSLSLGQKKKVLLAQSLSERAHVYVWDEPLNYIDVISRGHIEQLLLNSRATVIFVEHDGVFAKKIAQRTIALK